MAIRNSETPPSRFERVVTYVRSTLSSGDRASSDADDDGEADSTDALVNRGNLFHCETCNTVYIATEKDSCGDCQTEVEEVPSTLSCR